MITLVVMAHSRPASLRRLLRSIEALVSRDDVDLVIAVDPGAPDQDDVVAAARDVAWSSGGPEVLVAPRPLGLVGNFVRCGDLSRERGDVVIVEDDLELAPTAVEWARCALDVYRDDPGVLGVSLNSLWFNGFSHRRFEPVLDGSDCFFLQLPWFQGIAVTPAWWESWRPAGPEVAGELDIHPSFDAFGPQEWFPDAVRRVVQAGRSFAFPRSSHAVNHGEAGAHFGHRTDWFQTPLERRWRPPHLVSFADSLARYDQYFEYDSNLLASLVDGIPADVTMDLTAVRPLPASGPVITARPARDADRTWGGSRRPLEENVLRGQPGDLVSLADASVPGQGRLDAFRVARRLDLHEGHGRSRSLGRALLGRLLDAGGSRWR